ncbi:MAG: hypothetical protein RL329_1768 [Bacteroidota bacterium]|jgi:hypothetical protein
MSSKSLHKLGILYLGKEPFENQIVRQKGGIIPKKAKNSIKKVIN